MGKSASVVVVGMMLEALVATALGGQMAALIGVGWRLSQALSRMDTRLVRLETILEHEHGLLAREIRHQPNTQFRHRH